MTRLQILELPEGAGDDRPPFILVVDQTELQRIALGPEQDTWVSQWERIAREVGARTAIVTTETIEIPANDPLPPVEPQTSVQLDIRAGDQDAVAESLKRCGRSTSVRP